MARNRFIGNQRTSPTWMADWAGREHLALFPAKLDPAQFSDASGIKAVSTGVAAIAATSVPVTALTYPANASTTLISAGNVVIPKGTVLRFGADAKLAVLTADALVGATALTVAPLLTALAANDTAYYNKFGGIFVPSGTLIGRTFAERDANIAFGPADVAGPDDEIFLTAFDVADASDNADVELYRNGERVYENYLPNYASLSGPTVTKIRALYQCSKAVN